MAELSTLSAPSSTVLSPGGGTKVEAAVPRRENEGWGRGDDPRACPRGLLTSGQFGMRDCLPHETWGETYAVISATDLGHHRCPGSIFDLAWQCF